jgi:hypothetical protein
MRMTLSARREAEYADEVYRPDMKRG